MMVAGLGGVGTYWKPNIAAFTPHFRVILHDQRGTGRTSACLLHPSLKWRGMRVI